MKHLEYVPMKRHIKSKVASLQMTTLAMLAMLPLFN